MKNLIDKIIPYCSENFITIPLWEEGNYCLQLNVWQIFDLNKISNLISYFDEIISEVEKQHVGFSITFDLSKKTIDSRIIINFSIMQSDISKVCEPDFVYNYNIEEYMEVAITLLRIIEEFKKNNQFKK